MAAGVKVVAAGRGFPMGWQAAPLTESLLDRACIGLNLTLHSREEASDGIDPRFVSCFRVMEMLSRRVLVVSEEIPLDNPYGPYMVSAPPSDLPARCKSLIDSGEWRTLAAGKAAAFRSQMDVRTICAPVVARTVAGLERPKSRKGKR